MDKLKEAVPDELKPEPLKEYKENQGFRSEVKEPNKLEKALNTPEIIPEPTPETTISLDETEISVNNEEQQKNDDKEHDKPEVQSESLDDVKARLQELLTKKKIEENKKDLHNNNHGQTPFIKKDRNNKKPTQGNNPNSKYILAVLLIGCAVVIGVIKFSGKSKTHKSKQKPHDRQQLS